MRVFTVLDRFFIYYLMFSTLLDVYKMITSLTNLNSTFSWLGHAASSEKDELEDSH